MTELYEKAKKAEEVLDYFRNTYENLKRNDYLQFALPENKQDYLDVIFGAIFIDTFNNELSELAKEADSTAQRLRDKQVVNIRDLEKIIQILHKTLKSEADNFFF